MQYTHLYFAKRQQKKTIKAKNKKNKKQNNKNNRGFTVLAEACVYRQAYRYGS